MSKNKYHFKKIIFIIADTLRQINLEDLSTNRAKTPNIDYLKKNGVSFKSAYTSITKTDPSITAIMSGNYPLHNGVINHGELISKDEEKSAGNILYLPERLQKLGFKTCAVDWLGRWHKTGYDYYSGPIGKFLSTNPWYENFWFKFNPILFQLFSLRKLTVRLFKRELFLRLYYCLSKNPYVPYDSAEKVINKGIELINKNRHKKLFLYLHLWDPHEPHVRPKTIKSYMSDSVDNTYNAEIEFLDAQMGRLIEYLRKSGQMDKTLIVFTADHGENFYESGSPFYHDCLYENVVKIPLIFSNPQFIKKEAGSLVQNIDIVPTILDFLGSKKDNNLDGVSLKPIISGDKKQVRKTAYFEDVFKERRFSFLKKTRRRGILIGNYKYIQTISGNKKELTKIVSSANLKIINQEFYNIINDPKEKQNIFQKKKKSAEGYSRTLDKVLLTLNYKRLKINLALEKKVKKSLSIIREAIKRIPQSNIALAWTGGKDSTVLLHLVRLAFNGKVPFKVIFNDSTMEFEEIYAFIKTMTKLWNLDVITIKHTKKELVEFYKTKERDHKKKLSRLMKITAINNVLKKYRFKALVAGIRWDEHESRSKEIYFSKRPDHIRVHPILHFTEKDIWDYIHFFGVPYVDLYKKGYRSLGEKPFTKPAKEGEGERSGREKEKEQLMANLRKLGYW